MGTPSKKVIQKYRRNNKDKIKRRNKVNNDKNQGRAKKNHSCSKCGASKAEAHHKGNKVQWLCKKCHEKTHGYQG